MESVTTITLKDFHPEIDGEYPLNWEFQKRHWRIIKRMADVTPPELIRELKRANIDLAVALAAVALEQAGKPYLEDILWKDEGVIDIKETGGTDARPPDQSPPEEKPSESRLSSGPSTPATGELSPETTTQNGSGDPGSDTGADSVPATSPISLPLS